MPEGSIRVVRTLPNAANIGGILAAAVADGTAFAAAAGDEFARSASRLLPEGAAFSVESVPDLVETSLSMCGESRARRIAPAAGVREAVMAACEGMGDAGPFAASYRHPGFHRRLIGTFEDLWGAGLRSSDLRSISQKVAVELGAKLGALAELDDRVGSIFAGLGWEDRWARIDRCLNAKAERETRVGKVLVFLGSHSEPRLLDWVGWAAENGAHVTAVLDGRESTTGAFQTAGSVERLLGASETWTGRAHPIASALFGGSSRADASVSARIFSAADPLVEVEWALRSAAEEHERGREWCDMAIFAREQRTYAPLVRYAAERFGIPVSVPVRRLLCENGLVRFVVSTLDACDQPTARALWGLSGASYRRGYPTPQGERASAWEELAIRKGGDGSADAAAQLAEWRVRAGIAQSRTAWVERLRELSAQPWLEAAMDTSSPTSTEDVAAWSAMVRLLEVRASVRAQTRSALTLSEFLQDLRELSSREFHLSDDRSSSVRFASNSDELLDSGSLYVLGMLEGQFPRRRTEDPVLSDHDRAQISSFASEGRRLPDSRQVAGLERDEFVRVCSAARERATFSFPVAGEDRDNVPAFYLQEVRAAVPSIGAQAHGRAMLVPPDGESTLGADRALSAALGLPPVLPKPPSLAFPSAAALVRAGEGEAISPGALRDALVCAFQFAFKRRLGLRPPRKVDHWYLLAQLPQAAGLPAIATREAAMERLGEVWTERLGELEAELQPQESTLMHAGARRLFGQWVEREFDARALWPKQPGTVRPHAAFGGAGMAGELPVAGTSLKLKGAVTAVSKMGPYRVAHLMSARSSIVDAKTADSLSDPDRLELGLYLWALSGDASSVAVEAESILGDRTLFLLPRSAEFELSANVKGRLRVVDLGEPGAFFPEVRALLARAVEVARSGDSAPSPGSHCAYCDFGEICRNAEGFGEQEALFDGDPAEL